MSVLKHIILIERALYLTFLKRVTFCFFLNLIFIFQIEYKISFSYTRFVENCSNKILHLFFIHSIFSPQNLM